VSNKNEHWARVDLSGRNGGATIQLEVGQGGKRVLPISHMILQYGVNQIPQAAVFVPLGRNARTGDASPAYAAVDDLRAFSPATIRLLGNLGDVDAVGDVSGARRQFPPGPAVLFTGYVRGAVYRRMHGQLGLFVNLSNQLISLTLSSAGSTSFIPGSPDDLFSPTLLLGAGNSAGIGVMQTRYVALMSQMITVDFSAAILKCVEDIAKESLIQTHEYDSICGWPKSQAAYKSNTAALQALQPSGDWRGIANLAFADRKYPLQLPASGSLVGQYVGQRFASALASTNLWGMLSYAVISDFGMAIIPTATAAYLAPILRSAKKEAYAIYPDEYVDSTMTTGSLLPLYGVALVRQQSFGTQQISAINNTACVGGMYVPRKSTNEAAYPDGMWMFVRTPAWLDNWPLAVIEGVDPAVTLTETMTLPSTDALSGVKDTITTPPGNGAKELSTMMTQFAQMRYAENLLRGREGAIVGRLRFDISPGTLLRIVGKSRDRAGSSEQEDTLATDMFGFVSQVTIAINAQQSMATTSFQVTDLRTAEENARVGMSMSTHPFFSDNYFKHEALVPELTP